MDTHNTQEGSKAPNWNFSQTARLARKLLGPTSRVWHRGSTVEIGTEHGPNKKVVVTAPSFNEAVEGLIKVISEGL